VHHADLSLATLSSPGSKDYPLREAWFGILMRRDRPVPVLSTKNVPLMCKL
jgi:hypothetical protein